MIPNLGDIVYLASCLIKVTPQPVATFPDTPNQYSADMKVIGDPGGWDLSALAGQTGPAGRALFGLRDAYDVDPTRPVVNTPADLPTDLTDLATDIGLYWVIDTLDSFGHVIMTTAYVWYGTSWRQFMTGAFGPPGPVPQVQASVTDITPGSDAFVATSGPSLQPSWGFHLPVPAGPVGPVGPLALFGDVDEHTVAPLNPSVLGFAGTFTEFGEELWVPMQVNPAVLATYSMPQAAFTAVISIAQYLRVGTFTVPAQPYDWTPVVWGHLCAGAASGLASQKVGALVILGDDSQINASGIQAGPGVLVGRGFGNRGGEVNIMPHYSTPQTSARAITPTNNAATVAAGSPATLNVGLWNDGHLGFYTFSPTASPPPLTTLVTNVSNAIGSPQTTLNNIAATLTNWTSSIHTDLQNALNTVANLLSGIHLPNLSNIVSAVGSIGASIGADITNFIHALPTDVATTLTNFGNNLHAIANNLGLGGVVNALDSVGQHLANNISTGIATITTNVQTSIDAIGNGLGLSGNGLLGSTVSGLVTNFQSLVNNALNALGLGPVADGLTAVQNTLHSIGTNVSGTVQSAIDSLGNALGLTGTGLLGSTVSTLIGNFSSVLNNAVSNFNLGAITDPFAAVNSTLATMESNFAAGLQTMTADIQSSLDHIGTMFGFTGSGFPISQITNALSTVQPALDNLGAQLGMITIPNLISGLSSFTGTLTSDARNALDNLTSRLGQGVGNSVATVHGILGNIQNAIDNVAANLGLTGLGHSVTDIFNGLLNLLGGAGAGLSTGLQNALNTLGNLINIGGLITNIDNALVNLEPLIGSTLSRFTTDAQVFINVIPINPSPFTFLGTEG